jgi:CYTH domain-containing protein
MSMMSSIDTEKQWIKDLLSGLVGATVVQIDAATNEDGEVWPILVFQDKNDNIIQAEISMDAEGNGPGHIFLGALKGENFDEYSMISDKKSWEMLWSGIKKP